MVKFLKTLLLMTLVILCTGCGNSNDKDIRFGTGNVGGMYHTYGVQLANLIKDSGNNWGIDVRNSTGSEANLRLIKENFFDMAIVQNDILLSIVNADKLSNSESRSSNSNSNLNYSAIAGLYTEACQIVVLKDSPIMSINDLIGKKVSVGEGESGVLRNTERVLLSYGISFDKSSPIHSKNSVENMTEELLKLHGINFEMLEPLYLSFEESTRALADGTIDAMFIMAGTPTEAISKLAAQKEIRLLSIDLTIQNNLTRLYDGYERCTIPANTYPGQTEDVQTIGVKAVLVANPDLDADKVNYITEFIFENSDKLPHNFGSRLTLDYAVENIGLNFHSGSVKYYASQGLDVNKHEED